MGFTNSDLTLEDLQTRANFDRQEDINNQVIIQAVNDALSIYQRIERSSYPNRYAKTLQNQVITSSGLDLLVSIHDLGSDEEVFDNSTRVPNQSHRYKYTEYLHRKLVPS